MKIAIRNYVAKYARLQRGGVHDEDNPKVRHKKDRKQAKLALKKQVWD